MISRHNIIPDKANSLLSHVATVIDPDLAPQAASLFSYGLKCRAGTDRRVGR